MANGKVCSLDHAINLIPSGVFVLTAAHEHSRSGVLVRWVQQCSIDPPMVMVALPLGQAIEPLIRDSRSFALCQISCEDRFTERKFSTPPSPGEDPLVAMVRYSAPSGSPIIERAVSYLDCELIRHIDIEADYGLYVGLVRHGEVLNNARPAVHLGFNGSRINGAAGGTNGESNGKSA